MGALLKDKGWDAVAEEHRVFTIWEDAVGRHIARHAHPERIKRGVLFVIVSSPTWNQELTLKKKEILQRLNEHLGKHLITDITFAPGEVEFEEKKPEEKKTKRAKTPGDETIEHYTENINDRELKRVASNVLKKALTRDDEE
jgi:predicted nucleic acid-binding Zn ribbon protein